MEWFFFSFSLLFRSTAYYIIIFFSVALLRLYLFKKYWHSILERRIRISGILFFFMDFRQSIAFKLFIVSMVNSAWNYVLSLNIPQNQQNFFLLHFFNRDVFILIAVTTNPSWFGNSHQIEKKKKLFRF